MSGEEFKQGEEQGLLIGKVDALSESIKDLKNSFDNFVTGTGARMHKGEERMGEHDTEITLLKVNVKDLSDAKKWVITSVVGAVLIALIGLVIKK